MIGRWFERRRSLAGMRAFVTGGSSGVGRAIAAELARRGVRVFATARRRERLAELAATPLPHGSPPILIGDGDITSAFDRTSLLNTAVERLGGIEIVVAAAGSGAVGPFVESTPDTLRRIMEIDFFAPAELARESLPLLRRRGGAFVFVGSILGCHPLPLHAEYCAAKAAIRALAGSLRVELAAEDVDVVLASIGPTESEFWDNLLAGERPSWSRGRAMSAASTAVAVADAIACRRPEVCPGWSALGFTLAARYAPWLIDLAVSRRIRPGSDPGSVQPPS